MQEEVENKSVALSIKATKLTANVANTAGFPGALVLLNKNI